MRGQAFSRLTLGTAQLGLAYGPTAAQGVMGEAQAQAILSAAAACGVTCLDTAAAYGVAEARIGAWCRETGAAPVIISKLPALVGDVDPARAINDSLKQSLQRLGRTRLDGYLVHRARDLARPAVVAQLQAALAARRIGAFGVSVYSPAEVEQALGVAGLSLLQVPLSLVNQEMVESGVLAKAAAAGCVVCARSVLVQGMVLCPVDKLPARRAEAAEVLVQLHGLAAEAGFSLLAIALAAAQRAEVQSLVVGCDGPDQVREVAVGLEEAVPRDVVAAAIDLARDLPAEVGDPRRWTP